MLYARRRAGRLAHRVARAFWGGPATAIPFPRLFARWCIRIGYLPDHPEFVDFLRRAIFVPLHPRDEDSELTGYFDMGLMSRRQVDRFADWFGRHVGPTDVWATVSKSLARHG